MVICLSSKETDHGAAPVNALSLELIDELLAAFGKAPEDEAVRAVVLSSAHKVFCAVLDLDIIVSRPSMVPREPLA